jgi:TfoX/Sxy family transcriptional regulator of competence genes
MAARAFGQLHRRGGRYHAHVAYDEALAARIRAALAARPDVEEKRMFGGLSFMVAGQMCCGVLKDEMIVRIEPDDFPHLAEKPHVRAFDFSGRPMQGMVYVGQSALSSDPELETWIKRGVDYIAAHPAKPKRKRS